MASFSHTIPVGVSSVQLWALVRDVARVAGLFPYTNVEELTSPEPDCWLFWRQLTIPNVADLRWRERARVTGDGELHFEAVEGDLRMFAGDWRVTPNDTAAVLTLALEYEIPEEMRQGRFGTLHGWLKENIYRHGRKFTMDELAQSATGAPLTIEPYIRYLGTKYGELYDLR